MMRFLPFIQAPSWNSACRASLDSMVQTSSRSSAKRGSARVARSRGRGRSIGDVLVDPARPPLEDDDAVAHQHRLLDRMGDEQHGGRPPLPDAQQLELQDLARLGVDRREWLVHQQDARLDRERAREAAALLHAARHLIGIGMLEPAQAHQVHEGGHAPRDLIPGRARHAQSVGDVVVDRLPGKEAEMLEHHGDARWRLHDALAVDQHLALARDEPVDAAQQRGLAAARGADQRHDLALAYGEVEIGEDGKLAIALAEAANLDAA